MPRTRSLPALRVLVTLAALQALNTVHAQGPFTGTWALDLRTAGERRRNLGCGRATFELTQTQDRIAGVHRMTTVGCGRSNEEGPVVGVVVGDTAVLVVTSGRNGAVVFGRAKRVGGRLAWEVVEGVREGEPAGDSPLILHQGLLDRAAD